MANFNVDTNGNLWIGTNTSDTFSTAQGQSATKFYVESDGTIKAEAGTIGGITLNSSDIQANYSSGTSGFKIDTNGDAEFNSVDIRIEQATSDTPSTGFTTLDIGSTQIYENNDDLYINTSGTNNFVKIRDRLILTPTSSSGSTMQLMFDGFGTNDDMGFRLESGFPTSPDDADLIWTNQSGADDYNKIAYITTQDDYLHLGADAPGIKTDYTGSPTLLFDGPGSSSSDSATFNMSVRPYAIKDKDGELGTSRQVLSSTGTRIDWIDLPSGNTHPDSDHTSFLTQTTGDTRYVLSSSHSHNFDDYDHWDAKATTGGSTTNMQMNSGFGLEFAAGTGISFNVQTSPSYKITVNNTATGSSGVTTVNRTVSSYSDGVFMKKNVGLATAGTTLNYYLSTRGDDLTIDDARPSSNKASDFGISTNEYDVIHAETGQFTFVYGANFGGGSSQYFKKDVSDISLGLDFINALEPKSYKYKEQVYGSDDKLGFGLIAEDVSTVLDTFNVSNTKLFKEGRTDYKYYGQCSHELICTCEDIECCPEPMLDYDRETEEWTQTEGCDKNAKCTMPCCTDIAGITIDGVNFVHASEEECEIEFIDVRKHPSLKYDELIAPLVKAVQELSTQISDLTDRIEALEG